jgi:hypothetical protein
MAHGKWGNPYHTQVSSDQAADHKEWACATHICWRLSLV